MGRLLDNIKSVFNTQGDNITEAIGNIENNSGDSGSSNIVLLSLDTSTMTLGATYNEIKTYLEEGKIPTLFTSMQQPETEEENYIMGTYFLGQLGVESGKIEKKYVAMFQGFAAGSISFAPFSSSSPDEGLIFDQSLLPNSGGGGSNTMS